MAASKKHQSLKGDQLEREGQEKIREGEIAEAVAGPEGARCDGGEDEDNVHASRVNEQLAMAEDGDGREPIDIGDHVEDHEDTDATMVVVGLDTLQADAYELGNSGPTVADVNPEYSETDDVIEVVLPDRTDLDIDQKRYAYPRERLEVVARVHDRDGDEEVGE